MFWGGYAAFLAIIFATHWDSSLTDFSGAVGKARLALIIVWLGFLGYSVFCIPRESLWRSAKEILSLKWGWQVTVDLYISVLLSIALIWLVTGSIVETMLWSIACIPFANLAILPFLILHVEEIFAGFGLQ